MGKDATPLSRESRDGRCMFCGAQNLDESWDEITVCDTCGLALHRGFSIEEARLEVEDTARFWTPRFGRSEGRRCTCDAGPDHVYIEGPKVRGRGAGTRIGVIHFDVTHTTGCPLAPAVFDWPEVDEDARESVFGYRGQEHHADRLIDGLRGLLDWQANVDEREIVRETTGV